MAVFTIQVQSAISPFVCTLEFGQPLCYLKCKTHPCRACPYADNKSVGEPNTPLAFRRRDACHLNQQAGHRRIIVCIGQDTEKPISRVADYDTCILLILLQKNRIEL